MILQKVKEGDQIKALYQSSNILASSFNETNNDLNVIFKNGGNYTYQNVTSTDYLRFETAPSQGVVLNTVIKQYPFLKHENVNINEVVDRINTLRQEEITEFAMSLATDLKSVHKSYLETATFDSNDLINLSKKILIYQDLIR